MSLRCVFHQPLLMELILHSSDICSILPTLISKLRWNHFPIGFLHSPSKTNHDPKTIGARCLSITLQSVVSAVHLLVDKEFHVRAVSVDLGRTWQRCNRNVRRTSCWVVVLTLDSVRAGKKARRYIP